MTYYNQEFEMIVLGAMLLEPNILDDYNFYDDLFSKQNNKIIFKTIVECIENGVKPDIMVISEKLKDAEITAGYISSLTSKVLAVSNVAFYLKELEELSRKRKLEMMIKICAAELNAKTSQEIIEKIEDSLTHLNEEKSKGYLQLREYTTKAIERIEKKYHGTFGGIRVGYRDVDYLMDDLPGGTLNIIAARTSMGKTATALNIAHNILRQNKKVGFFSLEMSGDLLAERFIQKIAMVNTRKIRDLKKEGFERINSACENIYDLKIWVDDTPNIYLYDLKSKSRKMKREGIEIIFIDFLSLIRIQNEKLSLYEKYGMISHELKALARELEIPIVALSQLTRNAEDNKPNLADLRNSGMIEEDADCVVLLSGKRVDENVELIFDIAKNRNGSIGECRLMFKKEYQLISDIDYSAQP
jgi:replicative DNA helicase